MYSAGNEGSTNPPGTVVGANVPSNTSIRPLLKSAAYRRSLVPLLPIARPVDTAPSVAENSVAAVEPPFQTAMWPDSVSKRNAALVPPGNRKDGVKLNTWPLGLAGVVTIRGLPPGCGTPAAL